MSAPLHHEVQHGKQSLRPLGQVKAFVSHLTSMQALQQDEMKMVHGAVSMHTLTVEEVAGLRGRRQRLRK